MSAVITRAAKHRLTSEEEETLYLRDASPNTITISIDHLEVDKICSQCGHWKSEHPWETCKEPNWL